jgi:hypothetical protein
MEVWSANSAERYQPNEFLPKRYLDVVAEDPLETGRSAQIAEAFAAGARMPVEFAKSHGTCVDAQPHTGQDEVRDGDRATATSSSPVSSTFSTIRSSGSKKMANRKTICTPRYILGSFHSDSPISATPPSNLSQSPYWMPIRGPGSVPFDTA